MATQEHSCEALPQFFALKGEAEWLPSDYDFRDFLEEFRNWCMMEKAEKFYTEITTIIPFRERMERIAYPFLEDAG